MPEAAIGTPERVAKTLVTSENLVAFNAKRLDLTPVSVAPPELPAGGEKPPTLEVLPPSTSNAKQPAAAAEPIEETAKLQEELKAEEAKSQPDEKKKEGIRERLSVLTQKRKDAEAETAKERARAEKAERELAEVRSKAAEPLPPPKEIGAEPQRAQFATEQEYLDARVSFQVDKTLSERAKTEAEARAKAEGERVVQTYGERLALVKAEVADFDQRIEKAKDLPIPPHISQAIYESEHGPRMVLYFADHPEEATRIARLGQNAAVREFGKIEAMFETKAPAQTVQKPAAEVSKAPPPIAPLKGASSAVDAKVDSEGRFNGTYAEFKKLRKEGKMS